MRSDDLPPLYSHNHTWAPRPSTVLPLHDTKLPTFLSVCTSRCHESQLTSHVRLATRSDVFTATTEPTAAAAAAGIDRSVRGRAKRPCLFCRQLSPRLPICSLCVRKHSGKRSALAAAARTRPLPLRPMLCSKPWDKTKYWMGAAR